MRAPPPPLRPREDDDFRADEPRDDDDFRALDPRDDDFRAEDFRAEDFRALEPLFRADDLRAVDFRALDFRADDFRAPPALFRADVFLRADPPREADFLDDDFREDEARELDPEPRALPDLLLPPLRLRAPPDRLVALFARPPLREPPLRFDLVAMLLLLMKEGVRDLMQNPRTERGSRRRACCIARLTPRDSWGAHGV